MHINWEKSNLNQHVLSRQPDNYALGWNLYSFKHFVLTQICNQCLSLNLLCMFRLVVIWSWRVFKYSVTDDDVSNIENVIIFLKITICLLLSRTFKVGLFFTLRMMPQCVTIESYGTVLSCGTVCLLFCTRRGCCCFFNWVCGWNLTVWPFK